jgi:hypothetical protein
MDSFKGGPRLAGESSSVRPVVRGLSLEATPRGNAHAGRGDSVTHATVHRSIQNSPTLAEALHHRTRPVWRS